MDYWKVWIDVKRCYSMAMNRSSCKWLILVSNVMVLIWVYTSVVESVNPYTVAHRLKEPVHLEGIKVSLVDPGDLLTFIANLHLNPAGGTESIDPSQTTGSGAWVRDISWAFYRGIDHILGMTWLYVLLPFSLFFMGKVCFEPFQKDTRLSTPASGYFWPVPLIGVLLLGISLLMPAIMLILLVNSSDIRETVFHQIDVFLLVSIYVSVISIITSIIFYYRKNLEQAYLKLRASWLLFAILVPIGGLCLNSTLSFTNESNVLIPGTFQDPGMMKGLLIWIPGVLMVMMGSRRSQWSL